MANTDESYAQLFSIIINSTEVINTKWRESVSDIESKVEELTKENLILKDYIHDLQVMSGRPPQMATYYNSVKGCELTDEGGDPKDYREFYIFPDSPASLASIAVTCSNYSLSSNKMVYDEEGHKFCGSSSNNYQTCMGGINYLYPSYDHHN